MKYKISDLEGYLLDAAVAKAEGLKYAIDFFASNPPKGHAVWLVGSDGRPDRGAPWAPSTNWAQGGPIIERERIVVVEFLRGVEPQRLSDPSLAVSQAWRGLAGGVMCDNDHNIAGEFEQFGATYLVAAMRSYVASKFGDEIELP